MSNIFRDSESLGKSGGKKWSNIWTFLFGSGLKSPRKKSVFFADFALVHPPMASVLLSASVERCFVSRMRDFIIITYFDAVQCFWRLWVLCEMTALQVLSIDTMHFLWSQKIGTSEMKNTVQWSRVVVQCSEIHQAPRICLEWSSDAIYFSTHQCELIYHNSKKGLIAY